jgi:hypothetical protein
MPRKVLIDWPWLADSLPEEDTDLDIVEKVERFTAPRCKQAEALLGECRAEIVNLRVELAKEMRDVHWLRAEVERLHALLHECRRTSFSKFLYEGEG